MIVSNVDRMTLERAAALVGCRIDLSTINAKGTRFRVKLSRDATDPRPTSGRKGDGRYQKHGAQRNAKGERRRSGALCWHGFRDFFRAVFVVAPRARFATSVATWDGAEDFEQRYERTADHNVGSRMDPLCFGDACGCEQDGGIEANNGTPPARDYTAPHARELPGCMAPAELPR